MESGTAISTDFATRGAELFPSVLSEHELQLVEAAASDFSTASAGTRFRDLSSLRPLVAADGTIGSIAAHVLGNTCQPVRAILFDKNRETNWGLGWHQDRAIAVAARIETDGFDRWTVKDGIPHVEPPFDIIEAMVTLRVHLDDVDENNAPLLIAPGSHRLGRLTEDRLEEVVIACGSLACFASRGDIWANATSIVHASAPAREPGRRRILQIDYSAQNLPAPLSWMTL